MKHDVILKAFGTLCVQCVLSEQLFFSACGMLMLLSIMGHSCMGEAWPGRVVLTGAFTAETDPIPCLQPCPFSLSSSRSATGLRPSAQCLTDSAQEFRSFPTRPHGTLKHVLKSETQVSFRPQTLRSCHSTQFEGKAWQPWKGSRPSQLDSGSFTLRLHFKPLGLHFHFSPKISPPVPI